MDAANLKKLKRKAVFMFILAFAVLAVFLFLPAGSLKYWPGWIFCAVTLIPAFFVSDYFLKKSPDFLERRLKFKEKEIKQQLIIRISGIIFFIGFLVPGFDYRFGWSNVPAWLVIASNAIYLLGYFLVFLAFKANPFAGRTVEIFEGHKVIDTGPYAIVRHPMYAGVIPMLLAMPTALGSFWALIPFIPVCVIIIVRALNEEEVLKRDLPGYVEYCKKVRYRIIPFIW